MVLLDGARVSRTVGQEYPALVPETIQVKTNERRCRTTKGKKTFGTTGPIGEMVVVHCAEDECSHRPDTWSGCLWNGRQKFSDKKKNKKNKYTTIKKKSLISGDEQQNRRKKTKKKQKKIKKKQNNN